MFVSVSESRGMLWHLVHDLIYTKINKMAAFFPISPVHIVGLRGISFFLFTKPSDGEHKEQPLQWLGQQCQQQQQTDGVAPSHAKLANASSALDTKSTPAKPPGSAATLATTTTISVQAWGILANLPYHILLGQGPNGS